MTTTHLTALTASWLRSLRARNASDATLNTYGTSVRQFISFLTDHGNVFGADDTAATREVHQIDRHHVEDFLIFLRDGGRSPATVSNRYRALAQFFKWAAEEEEITPNPMRNIKPPRVPVDDVPLLTDDELKALLHTVRGRSFVELRDHAILAMFLDTGMRRAELAGLQIADLHLDWDAAYVLGKGGKHRTCVYGKKTATILDRYLRARGRQQGRDLEALWLDSRGSSVLGYWGVGQMLERRGNEAGIENLYPHRLRHQFAHNFLDAGGSEGDLMRLAGWTSDQMTRRYGSSGAVERAKKVGRQLSTMDRL